MSYYDQAKHTCPLCRSSMTATVDPGGESWLYATDQCQWEVFHCTAPACGVMWSYGEIHDGDTDQARIIELDEGPPWEKRSRLTLRIEWSMGEGSPEGRVQAVLTRKRQPFRKAPTPMAIDVKAAALAAGDRDTALREAFSVWRLRSFV